MPTVIPRPVLENFLLGPEVGRRFMQDSPILPDVWFEYGAAPDAARSLLITPFETTAASLVAYELANNLAADANLSTDEPDFGVAYLHGVVSARISFHQLVTGALPMTGWWKDNELDAVLNLPKISQNALTDFVFNEAVVPFGVPLRGDQADHAERLTAAIARRLHRKPGKPTPRLRRRAGAVVNRLAMGARYFAAIGILLWAADVDGATIPEDWQQDGTAWPFSDEPLFGEVTELALTTLREASRRQPARGRIYNVSRDRTTQLAVHDSVPATKADAARRLFEIDCSPIHWAVIDSGINGKHPAFHDNATGKSRVVAHYDFTQVHDILSVDKAIFKRKREAFLQGFYEARAITDEKKKTLLAKNLETLSDNARQGHAVEWNLVQPFVEMASQGKPRLDHGTHVAGILGANWAVKDGHLGSNDMVGMCPEIKLHDFRVVGGDIAATEFAVIAALQYIRHLNRKNDFIAIHGANLSLSIPHDVRNYACGRTPICDECEKLVGSGVMVVAAAGNLGYQRYETRDGLYEGYSAFNITDPGNADRVMTVGATHRFWPHTYGVSFFSSRGPTGDGRMKPDLVAPGEKITAPLGNGEFGLLDGTSMAAPHVSGAAAMLMARYSELRGQPQRVKDILCRTATDLGRERSFQGNGMLDVLRALQSV